MNGYGRFISKSYDIKKRLNKAFYHYILAIFIKQLSQQGNLKTVDFE
ncbi:50S ribosomal protein L4 [Psychrobacter sp. 1501(2011)]|nr:50S ribosomal protein L4 [Psychrobacter sp. 1501(2011)]